ncbi:MAG: pyridoxal-phosphate dependent enzyme, partial [Clostridia bacterium]
SRGLTPDGVVAGVGTGGTVMGIIRRLRMENPHCKAFPLEPANSPTLSTGYKTGKHRIYGISDEFIPSILKLSEMDHIVSVDDGDAICMARLLSETLGIGVGVSSGANFLGCILAQDRLGEDAVIVTVFADDNKKYLSTDYAKSCPAPPDSLTAAVRLQGVTVIR